MSRHITVPITVHIDFDDEEHRTSLSVGGTLSMNENHLNDYQTSRHVSVSLPGPNNQNHQNHNENNRNNVVQLSERYLNDSYFDLLLISGQERVCCVCHDSICCKRTFSLLNCGHYLHTDCLRRLGACPLCRRPLAS